MIAMTATRLGRPEVAVEILLRDGPNNVYTASGLCPQRSDSAITAGGAPARKWEIAAYLPANGAFLSAVALMVAGWDGSTRRVARLSRRRDVEGAGGRLAPAALAVSPRRARST
jgi:hypothetical protein